MAELNHDYMAMVYQARLDDAQARIAEAKREERERLIKLVHEETFHNGATHYPGINCTICKVLLIMEGEEQ